MVTQIPGKTYQIHSVNNSSPAELQKTLANNNKVDVILEQNNHLFHLSGDKISLKELSTAYPQISNQLSLFDVNEDGFIVENELKHNYTEAKAHVESHTASAVHDEGQFVSPLTAAASASLGGAIGGGLANGIGKVMSSTAADGMMGEVNSAATIARGKFWMSKSGIALGIGLGAAAAYGGYKLYEHSKASTIEQIQAPQTIQNKIEDKMAEYKTSEWNQANTVKLIR